jgi:hypothetical protein
MKKLMILLVLAAPLSARYHKVTRLQDFEKLVDGYEYSVACFASSSKQKDENISPDLLKNRHKGFRNLQEMLQAAASKPDFKKFLPKDIGFIAVDVTAKHGQDFIKDFSVGQAPVCYVFEEGAQDKGSRLVRPESTKDLIDLLEETAGSDLDAILAERKEEKNQDRQERIAQYYAYGGFYPYGWGYGWGGSSYWGRPYWGWGYLW